MHPILYEDVELWTETEDSEIRYYVCKENEKVYKISKEVFNSLFKADGTHKFEVFGALHENNELIKKVFFQSKILNQHRLVLEGMLNRFILLPLGNRFDWTKEICSILNKILPYLSIVFFVVGIIVWKTTSIQFFGGYSFLFYIGLFLLSILLHEVGHMIAGISSGYSMREFGILLFIIFPIGAYVSCFEPEKISKYKRIQFILSGIEVNMVLFGLFMIFSRVLNSYALVYEQIAFVNLAMVFLNIFPIGLLDGGQALSILLDIDLSKIMFKSYKRVKICKNRKLSFVGAICLKTILCIFVVLFILLCLLNIFMIFEIVVGLIMT